MKFNPYIQYILTCSMSHSLIQGGVDEGKGKKFSSSFVLFCCPSFCSLWGRGLGLVASSIFLKIISSNQNQSNLLKDRGGTLSSISLPIERAPPLSNSLHTIYPVPMYCIL